MTAKHLASTAMHAVRTGLLSDGDVPTRPRQRIRRRPDGHPPSRDNDTSTPIKHVIVIIGENRSFDHVFATYVPQKGETEWNLLSEGIVKADGTPGPELSAAEQKAATIRHPTNFC